MKVQIEGQLYLESDGMQFIIKEYSGKQDKAGNDLYKTHGYYSSVEGAIKGLVKKKIMESTAATLLELLGEVEGIKAYIESKVNI